MSPSGLVEIDERFRGIPGVALGGYVGGLLARGQDGAEVTLRRPVPLGKPLRFEASEDGATALLDGDETLASARPQPRLELDVPSAVTPEETLAASRRSLQLSPEYRHPFPGCRPRPRVIPRPTGSSRRSERSWRVADAPISGDRERGRSSATTRSSAAEERRGFRVQKA